jgi:hypothetical protein
VKTIEALHIALVVTPVVLGAAGSMIPFARDPRLRLLEASVLIALILVPPRYSSGHVAGAIVAGIIMFSIGRLLRAVQHLASLASGSAETGREIGAHVFYAAPLLALAIAKSWVITRSGRSLPLDYELILAFCSVINSRRPVFMGAAFSALILSTASVINWGMAGP